MAQELLQAVADCRLRGLHAPAKWAAAALCGLSEEDSSPGSTPAASSAGSSPAYELARSLFDVKEYRSAAHMLQDCQDPLSLFLRNYATYLAGEKRKEEGRIESKTANQAAEASNPELAALESELQSLVHSGQADGFLLYLLGMVLADRCGNWALRWQLLRTFSRGSAAGTFAASVLTDRQAGFLHSAGKLVAQVMQRGSCGPYGWADGLCSVSAWSKLVEYWA